MRKVKIRMMVGWGTGVGGEIFHKRHVRTTSRKIGLGWYKAGTLGTEYSDSTPAPIS